MELAGVFEKFLAQSPVAVMGRVLLGRVLDRERLDALFERNAEWQYRKELLFSTVVDVMTLVVCGVHPSVRSAYQALHAQIPVTLAALYDKLKHLEMATIEALVAHSAEELVPVLEELGGIERWVPGYRVKIVDGNHLCASEHRLEETRHTAAGPLPGQALVVLEPELGIVTQMVGCFDGHAQERSLLDRVLEQVQPGDLIVADRNFCTQGFLKGIVDRQAHFLIRQHAHLPVHSQGTLRSRGALDGAEVFEQPLTVGAEAKALSVRRLDIRLRTPTRDGDRSLAVLTNLPAEHADALLGAKMYRGRWSIESFFAHVERNLQSELCTLGYPPAALFAFAVALVAANLFAAIEATMRAAQRQQTDPAIATLPLSPMALVQAVRTVLPGLQIALGDEPFLPFEQLDPKPLAAWLRSLAPFIDWPRFRKTGRGPKKTPPPKPRSPHTPHVSTARLLGWV